MKFAIKEYWENLKVEYEATYNVMRLYLVIMMC